MNSLNDFYSYVFVGTGGFNTADAGSKTNTLTALEIGVADFNTSELIDVSGVGSVATNKMVFLAEGSSHSVDILPGSQHGGYQQSYKSKGIAPQYVDQFYVVAPVTPLNQILCIGCEDVHNFLCNQTWRLRLEVQGSPALRAMQHNLYKVFDGFTGCCGDDPDAPIDPSIVFEEWKTAINADVVFKHFVSAEISYWMEIATVWTDMGNSKPEDDQVCSATITNAGSYAGGTVPTWAFSGGAGTGAAADSVMGLLSTGTVSARGTGYAPGDVLAIVGGTYTTQAKVNVTETEVATAALLNAGTGYVGTEVITISTGAGTYATFTVSTVDAQGAILTFAITTRGTYTTNPTLAGAATSTTLIGDNATFTLTMGVKTVTQNVSGAYSGSATATPASPAATLDDGSGFGSGATVTVLWNVEDITITNKGDAYTSAPTMTASSGAAAATAVLCPDWDAAVLTDPQTVTNKLCITGAYTDTTFTDCSFNPTDMFDVAPIRILASVVQDDGTPCDDELFCIETTQEPVQGNGFGESAIRERIMFKRYMQEPFFSDPRERELRDDTSLSDVDRTLQYYSYYIVHNVPRKGNHSSLLDYDRYIIRILVTGRNANFENWMNSYLASVPNGVQLVERV